MTFLTNSNDKLFLLRKNVEEALKQQNIQITSAVLENLVDSLYTAGVDHISKYMEALLTLCKTYLKTQEDFKALNQSNLEFFAMSLMEQLLKQAEETIIKEDKIWQPNRS